MNTDGRREVLGMAIGASEANPFWTEFLRDLVGRGLSGVKRVICDAQESIKAAKARVLSPTCSAAGFQTKPAGDPCNSAIA